MPFATPVTGRYLRYVVNAVVPSGDGHGWWSACMYEMTIWAPGYGPTPPPPGALDHLVLTPATQTIVPDAHVTYTVEGFDAANISLGAITDAVLAITPDGSCSAYDCTASTPGGHTVTATKSGKTGTATLTVQAPGALDHLVLTPATQTIVPDAHVTYAVEGFDAANISLGAITDAVLAITPDGSCSAYDCTASTPGRHTVTATKSGKTGTATLTVQAPGALDHLVLTPANKTITLGQEPGLHGRGLRRRQQQPRQRHVYHDLRPQPRNRLLHRRDLHSDSRRHLHGHGE